MGPDMTSAVMKCPCGYTTILTRTPTRFIGNPLGVCQRCKQGVRREHKGLRDASTPA